MGFTARAKAKFIRTVCSATDLSFGRASLDERAAACLARRSVYAPLKVAFVKQSSYVDLYTLPSSDVSGQRRTKADVYGSSNFRSGPVGLLAHFECDFIIVKCADAPECRIWEYRLANEVSGDKATSERRARKRREQEIDAVESDSVDWSQYDLVICMENAVPAAINQKYPETIWATMLEWFGMPQYKRYLLKPPRGYDVFLTQMFSSTPFDCVLPSTALHWPYGFLHSSSFHELGILQAVEKGNSIVLDRNAESLCQDLFKDPSLAARLKILGGMNIKDFAVRMAEAKYYTSVGSSRLLWGNGTMDVAALGALILTDRSKLINSAVVGPECHVSNAEELRNNVQRLDADPDLYNSTLESQRRRLDYFAFWRPLFELHHYASKHTRFGQVAERLECFFDQG